MSKEDFPLLPKAIKVKPKLIGLDIVKPNDKTWYDKCITLAKASCNRWRSKPKQRR